jgi:phosphoglycerate dehydrogenase-like enzyme
MRVHLLDVPEAGALKELQSGLDPAIQLSMGRSLPQPADYEILVGGRPWKDWFTASPVLRTLIIPFAGLPPATRELLLGFPQIAVHNLHHNAGLTAETAVALLLAAAKFLLPFDRDLRRNDWTRRYQPNPSLLLDGKTALVLGFGAIGQRIGRVCHALGMRVLGVRRRAGAPEGLDYPAEVYPLEALPALLPQAQVLAAALPGTPETDGMLGDRELRALPAGAVLVNVGRAALIDQAALYRALADGHLRGAGLDVWYRYPESVEKRSQTAPADYPFHELDNVVLSPHRGGAADETETLRMRALADLLNRAARGEALPGRVDVAAGY